jgi:hypothetical protein
VLRCLLRRSLDVHAVMGQTADSELVVRGDKQSRHVALYSSRPWELSVGVRAVTLGAALAAAAPPCWLRRVCGDATRCRVRQFEHAGGFGLVAGAVNRMAVRLRPLSSGVQHTIVNLVDADDRRLVACWRVCVSTEPPVVTRAYDIALRVGTGVNKVCQAVAGPVAVLHAVLTHVYALYARRRLRTRIRGTSRSRSPCGRPIPRCAT